jgi:hypothetical protein
MLDRRGAAYDFYCATLFPSGTDQHQLIICDLSANDMTTSLDTLEISREVYSTFFWAADPFGCADGIVQTFVQCHNYWYPIELVYAYGGTLNGATPLFALAAEVH